MLNTKDIIQGSGIQFGTSGARGLVEQFSPEVCAAFVHAFISVMAKQFSFEQVAVAIDNRPSSPSMAQATVSVIKSLGLEAVYYGVIPTPALAYTAMQAKMPSIMITGSHIPFDRNGIKFYRPDGEISKSDEQAIIAESVSFDIVHHESRLDVNPSAVKAYEERYSVLFDRSFLQGKKVGIYEHSSAGRDIYANLFSSLGADVVSLERTNKFVPIDTEAVAESDREKARNWSKEYDLDFIFSTDGDGDRPLVADENGEWLRGDILGLLCSLALNAEAVALPISCNSIIKASDQFKKVVTTKIGSPYVIAEFAELSESYQSVVGFEANGGYLLGSDIEFHGNKLAALPTRDAILPALMLLSLSRSSELSITNLVARLPTRFTHSDRIQNFATSKSIELISIGKNNPDNLLELLGMDSLRTESVDLTDGLRLTLTNQDIIHLRPSGNAPELRCYAESNSVKEAENIVSISLDNINRKEIKC
ncbi:Phosphomannomutase [Vibrio nigripulchritudo SO65]|uniref:phosphomannomutase n=1 Tax=Vibrio nigripulchritudo TaxID=28173 RepID=UPI0003B21DEA|nr:phosphomannomutase [Vibrio nigripulchritudo]CCN35031.1 Phosphomannomutase [Vibrio nigripulchritudo AM115]CCN41687.1 Phosphomannomutase [Vibrio nigripulchritudo FTn2]CCN65066.1 Phosphomannomutase [Vibrio nigripulchritudo POn4]CCN73998.1 Phosphomannomutase [Vibrio nigripulchritudo SO65]